MATSMMCASSMAQQQLLGQHRIRLQRSPAMALAPRRATCHCARGTRGVVSVRADSNWSTNSVVRTVDTMLKRYDFVSTGLGALCVTGWFWSHGQPPLEALSIAAVSTIIALVVNELMFTGTNNTKA